MKNERGSIAVLAFVTVMFILIILATLYYSMVEKSKAQVIEMYKLSNSLDGDMGEIYQERKNAQGIFVTLYTDGSNGNLVFSNDNRVKEDAGTYTQYGDISDLSFTSTAQIPWYSSKDKITSAEIMDPISPTTTAMWFNGLDKLTTITNIDNLDTSKVTNMTSMFNGCKALTELDLSNFNTSNVTTMENMFMWCNNIKSLDLSNFDTRNVTNMHAMFIRCEGLETLNISNFDTRNVTNMEAMFRAAKSLTSLEFGPNFNTGNVTNMSGMFAGLNAITSLDVSRI